MKRQSNCDKDDDLWFMPASFSGEADDLAPPLPRADHSRLIDVDAWREAETKRIRTERRVLQRQTKAVHQIRPPDRKERTEIEALKAEVTKVKEERRQSELRSRLAMDRLKKQLAEASARVGESCVSPGLALLEVFTAPGRVLAECCASR